MDSSGGKLDPLQKRVLETLAGIEPPFVLSGGGALVPGFGRLRISDRNATAVVDLIAESGESLEPPAVHRIGEADILVDTAQAILVEKLCALLQRSELRDLLDIEALIRHGEDLDAAIEQAPRRDSGFSPLTLAWLLRDIDVKEIAASLEISTNDAARLDAFRGELIGRLLTPPRSRGA